jgi:deazaflavin-dependent oxidoreductase (nitroreductase family)
MAKKMMKAFGSFHTSLYRLTGGAIGGKMKKAPVLLLTTKGRKSGQKRTMPLLYLADGERLVAVASANGAPRNPAWFLNLEADPEVEVQVRKEVRPVRARRATPEEAEQLWPRLIEIWPSYESYKQKTTRELPVVIFEPR